MTDTPVPDVRELAAAAVTSAGRCDHPGAETCDPWWVADAVLAAVTPMIEERKAEAIVEKIRAHDERYGGRATRYAIGFSDALKTAAAIARSHSTVPAQPSNEGDNHDAG